MHFTLFCSQRSKFKSCLLLWGLECLVQAVLWIAPSAAISNFSIHWWYGVHSSENLIHTFLCWWIPAYPLCTHRRLVFKSPRTGCSRDGFVAWVCCLPVHELPFDMRSRLIVSHFVPSRCTYFMEAICTRTKNWIVSISCHISFRVDANTVHYRILEVSIGRRVHSY